VSRSRVVLLVATVAALALASSACPAKMVPATPGVDPWAVRVVTDFQNTTLAGPDRWVELFDFTAVGEFEILLHRYDLLGRLTNLTDDEKAQFAAEDGTPYPPERERRNVGNFYTILAQRTVGTGGCKAGPPEFHYNQLMGQPFPPLPPGNESYEPLRTKVNAHLENGRGGVIGIRCTGGKGSLALVWTKTSTQRGYDIITIYDDGSE
jgi:hypothetical protein